MGKNLIPEILKKLGVDYNEKFQLDNYGTESTKDNLFYFNENNGLLMVYPDGVTCDANGLVYGILCGYYTIVKLPWVPKYGDKYWSIHFIGTDKPSTAYHIWNSHISDFAYLRLGIVYRTQEEAEANLSKDYEKLIGKPLDKEVDNERKMDN